MFIFFFFFFLAVFIVGDLSDVSGANLSISGAGSCRSVLGEHKLLHDTRKLGSVSIGKGDRALQVRMPRLEVRMPRLEVRIVVQDKDKTQTSHHGGMQMDIRKGRGKAVHEQYYYIHM